MGVLPQGENLLACVHACVGMRVRGRSQALLRVHVHRVAGGLGAHVCARERAGMQCEYARELCNFVQAMYR